MNERLQQLLEAELAKPDAHEDEMVSRVNAYWTYIQELEGEKRFGVTGYQMLLKIMREAQRRNTVISIHNLRGEYWVVTETDQNTKAPRQLGLAKVGLFEALESATDFNTTV